MIALNENSSISVKPDKTRLQNLLEEIQSGALKIPVFQRDFIWKASQMIELLDSIAKGYPIGSLLFWRPEISFKTKEFIGPYKIVKSAKNVGYVLDGFQRITTLLGVLANPKKMGTVNEADLKNYLIYFDLKEREFTYLRRKKDSTPHLIPLYKVVDTFEFLDFLREIEARIIDKAESKILIDNAKALSKIFYDYEIPFVEIKGGDINSAVQIFSRVNSTGTEISEDFMLSALSYNQETDFLFSDHITEFINDLSVFNFDNLKRDTVLNCISNTKGKIYFDVKVEDLLKPNLETLTHLAFVHIRRAIEFLNHDLFVLESKLLPYPTQLIFISEFFRVNPFPDFDQIQSLKDWFWVTTYANYFTIYSLSLQRAAYSRFMLFATDLDVDGVLWMEESFRTAKFPEKINFTGVRTKALQLFMLNATYRDKEVLQGDSIKEIYFFSNRERTPGNVLIRTISDHEKHFFGADMSAFINNTPISELKNYFINSQLIQLFNANRSDDFILLREELIKTREQEFVESFGLIYDRLAL